MLVLVLALSIIYFPMDAIVALAYQALDSSIADYSYMTIDDSEDGYTVNKGDSYKIPNAYIGGNDDYVIGDSNLIDSSDYENGSGLTSVSLFGDAIFESSNVTVTYSGLVITSSDNEEYNGTFTASRVGTYTITYSYTYTLNGSTYTNSYELEVESVLASVNLDFEDNTEYFLPSVLDLTLYQNEDETYDDLYLPLPTITDENGDEIKKVEFVTSTNELDSGTNYVVITAKGGATGGTVEISTDGGDFYISGDYFSSANYGAGNYVVTYSYYEGQNFVKSVTKTTVVYSTENKYYTDYELDLELSSDWTDDGQTGVASTLPSAVGVTSSDTTPASESVDVYYTVEVLYTSGSSSSSYAELNYKLYEDVLVEVKDGDTHVKYILADPTEFTPLEDGSYTFIYTIYDIYGNSVSSSLGYHEFENITDVTAPTPIIYDASEYDEDEGYQDVSHKLSSYTITNGIVIYAIGMDDNVSKVGDEGVELKRVIMTDETVTKLTIEGYDSYNLVFNYSDLGSGAFNALITNNYYIRKALSNGGYSWTTSTDAAENDYSARADLIYSEETMLTWLKAHNYLIVIDNANASTIYDLFTTEILDADGSVESSTNYFTANISSSITDGATLLAWLANQDEETIAGYGFAYIDADETFGATTNDGGMGTGTYYIHYVATDAANNETDTYQAMTIVGTASYDSDYPTITFSTTLQTVYTASSTITFNVPTASDTHDTNIVVNTWYRFLDEDGKPIEVTDDDTVISVNDLASVFEDLDYTGATSNGAYLTNTYSKYHTSSSSGAITNDGYIDLTDSSASTYSIDLSQGGQQAVTIQIFVFVYDDAGNVGVYAETIEIANSQDTIDPQLYSIEGADTTEYNQGETIELPTVTVLDDAVSYMGFTIKMVYIDDDGNEVSVDPYGYSQDRQIADGKTGGYYSVIGGQVVLSYAGNYRLSIAVYDSRGATIVTFFNYTANGRTIIQSPTISSTLADTQTIEVDDYAIGETLELPIPTLSYEIYDSVTYDEYTSDDYTGNATFVVYGVNEDGKLVDYSTSFGQLGSLTPRALWKSRGSLSQLEYELIYTARITVYNKNYFTYVEMSFDEENGYTPGGYFTYTSEDTLTTVKVEALDDGTLEVEEGSTTYIVALDEDGDVTVYLNGEEFETYTGTIFEDIENRDDLSLRTWFNGLKKYVLTSKTYRIILQDTTAPTITEYDYKDYEQLSIEDLTEKYNSTLTIYAIEEDSDASGIDVSKSTIVLSWSLADGTSSSQTWTGLDVLEDVTYSIGSSTAAQNGTYTVTYTAYDTLGNYSTSTYSFAVGDNVSPTITYDSDIVSSSYEIGSSDLSPLVIDLGKISVWDNNDLPTEIPTVTLTNSSGEEIEADESSNDDYLYFYIDTVDTYTLTFTITDAVGWTTTSSTTFEVTSETQEASMVYQIVGTILIVVSVLVLAGVIIYFIVSKVKLDKELKK